MGEDRAPAAGAFADEDWSALARVAAGDAGAFEGLVERHQGRLLALAERFLGEPEAARDAVQDVFLDLYRSAARLSPQARLSTLLYRMTANRCLNLLRRRRLVRMLSFAAAGEEADGPLVEPADPRPGAHAELTARRLWRRLRRAIEELPAGQRAVLVLVRFEGLSYRDTADVLGITLGAVESRLVRAMRRLERAQEAADRGVP